ncbi:MAG: hypothetical protein AAF548_00530 [Actinomycetota bacterium]
MRTAVLLLAVIVAACSVDDGSSDAGPPTTAPASTSSTTTTTTEPAPVSTALIRIGPARYELEAVCAAGGAGEIEVSAAGSDVNGLPAAAYIRAFLTDPYVSLLVGEGDDAVFFEPRIDRVLDVELTDDGVRMAEVDFVSGLDLSTGDFTPAGLGAVEVICQGYERALPEP